MRLLLDTAALIFAVEFPERLSRRTKQVIEDSENILELSVISMIEIAIKSSKGKLQFSEDTLRQVIEDLDLRLLSYTPEHAFLLFQLPAHHKDPFDRQIIAQAISEKVAVVTPDEKFRLYKGLRIIW